MCIGKYLLCLEKAVKSLPLLPDPTPATIVKLDHFNQPKQVLQLVPSAGLLHFMACCLFIS